MENKKRHKRVITILIVLIIAQFFSLLFIDEFTELESKNALAEMQQVIKNPNISINEKAKSLFRKEIENKYIYCNIRNLNITAEEKGTHLSILRQIGKTK